MLLLLLALPLSTAHMHLYYPPTFNSTNNPHRTTPADPYLDYPFNCCGLDARWILPCRNYTHLLPSASGEASSYPDGQPTASWPAGSKQNFTLAANAGGGNHYGGSCQVGFSVDGGETFRVATSFEGDCPHRNNGDGPAGQSFDFTVPADLERGVRLFAWVWYNREQEMNVNCAAVNITAPVEEPKQRRDVRGRRARRQLGSQHSHAGARRHAQAARGAGSEPPAAFEELYTSTTFAYDPTTTSTMPIARSSALSWAPYNPLPISSTQSSSSSLSFVWVSSTSKSSTASSEATSTSSNPYHQLTAWTISFSGYPTTVSTNAAPTHKPPHETQPDMTAVPAPSQPLEEPEYASFVNYHAAVRSERTTGSTTSAVLGASGATGSGPSTTTLTVYTTATTLKSLTQPNYAVFLTSASAPPSSTTSTTCTTPTQSPYSISAASAPPPSITTRTTYITALPSNPPPSPYSSSSPPPYSALPSPPSSSSTVPVAFSNRPLMFLSANTATTTDACRTPHTTAELRFPEPGLDVVEGDGVYPLEGPEGEC